MADPPYVTLPPGDPAEVAAAARRAAERMGLPAPTHLRTGMTALFRAGDETVLRVCRPNGDPHAAPRLAALLAAHGVRVPAHLAAPVVDPGGSTVYAIEALHESARTDWAEVGVMIRQVHELDPAAVAAVHPVAMCTEFPWWNTAAALADCDRLLDPAAARGLRTAIERHGGWAAIERPDVLCHGDLHPGNVLADATGRPVLIDWDLLCTGPAAWDHAVVMTWERRWGGAAGMYAAFADGYGRDLRGDEVAESLAVMRNVVATLGRVRAGRDDPVQAAEAERRLRFWRGEPDAPVWTPL